MKVIKRRHTLEVSEWWHWHTMQCRNLTCATLFMLEPTDVPIEKGKQSPGGSWEPLPFITFACPECGSVCTFYTIGPTGVGWDVGSSAGGMTP